MALNLGKLDKIEIIGEPSSQSRKLTKSCALPKLLEWEQFDNFASALQRLGWNPTQTADGPDARSWTFNRGRDSLWLVFDDLLGGSLKSEDPTLNLEAVAAQLESTSVP